MLAQALKTYGMFLADGGNIALTIASDRFSTAKWSALGVTNNRSLASLAVDDFEVVDYGTEVDCKADDSCHRNPCRRQTRGASVPSPGALDDARGGLGRRATGGEQELPARELQRQHDAEDVARARRVQLSCRRRRNVDALGASDQVAPRAPRVIAAVPPRSDD